MTNKLLIVTDGKAGRKPVQNPLFGSGIRYDCVRASYPTRLHKALSYLIDRLGLVLDFPFTIEKTDGYYAAVVCTGSTAFYPGKIAARRRGIPVAAILFPSGYKKLNFDCILAPVFDRPPHFRTSSRSRSTSPPPTTRSTKPRPPLFSNATRPPVRRSA